MLQQINEKQNRVQLSKLENDEQVMLKFKLRNEEESLKQRERAQKMLRHKKRLEIKKKVVLDKMMRHDEIVAIKRQQVQEAIELKRELSVELSLERREMRSVVAKSQESKQLSHSQRKGKNSPWYAVD